MRLSSGITRAVLIFTFGAGICISRASYAYFEAPKTTVKDPEMNGIRLSQFPKDFTQTWKTVTTRYRLDTGELRFTYANDKAWATANGLNSEYPDGSIFAKVGRTTEKDPAFPSSMVPSGTKRFQFMVRDKKKYKDTGGWGYALFDQNGQLYEGDIKTNSMACAACHSLVPERGYVFSRPMNLSFPAAENDNLNSRIAMKTRKTTKLPKRLREKVANLGETIDVVSGPLADTGFSGTLDEIVPMLIDSAAKSRRPTALILNEQNFSVVIPTIDSCDERRRKYQVFIEFHGSPVRSSEICQ